MSAITVHTPRLNLRKNVTFAVGEFGVNMALIFFSYRLVIIQGGLEAVGVWATLYAWINLIRLGDAGVAGAAARFLALWDIDGEQDRIRAHGETALLMNLVQFGLLALIGHAVLLPFVGHLVGAAHAAEATVVLPFMLAGFFLLNVAGTILGILQGLHLGYRRSQLSMLGAVIQLGIAFALVPGLGLTGLAVAQVGQYGTVAAIGWFIARRRMGGGWLPVRFDGKACRAMLGYSLKAQLVNITNGLVEPLTKLLVGHFGGMTAQGLFELAYKTVLVPRNLVGSGVLATVPTMSLLFQENREELWRLCRRAFRVAALSMGAAAIALVGTAPLVSYLWLGSVNATYWLFVSLVAGGFFFNALGAPAYMVGMASGHMRDNIIGTVTALSVLICAGLVLGVYFGAAGVVAANSMATGLNGIIITYLVRRKISRKSSADMAMNGALAHRTVIP